MKLIFVAILVHSSPDFMGNGPVEFKVAVCTEAIVPLRHLVRYWRERAQETKSRIAGLGYLLYFG